MGDTKERFGMPSNFARKEQFFGQQSAIGVSEKFLQSSSILLSSNFDYKTEKHQNLHQTKKLTKSNTYVDQLRISSSIKTTIMSEVECVTTGTLFS